MRPFRGRGRRHGPAAPLWPASGVWKRGGFVVCLASVRTAAALGQPAEARRACTVWWEPSGLGRRPEGPGVSLLLPPGPAGRGASHPRGPPAVGRPAHAGRWPGVSGTRPALRAFPGLFQPLWAGRGSMGREKSLPARKTGPRVSERQCGHVFEGFPPAPRPFEDLRMPSEVQPPSG